MTPQELKNSILQLAIQGKLVEQRPEEGTGEELYKQIQEEKAKLIKEDKIKKEKPLAKISDNEIPFDIPESWKWVYLYEVASSGLGKTLNKTNDKGELCQYLCSINVYWEGVKLDIIKETFFTDDDKKKYKLEIGDLLICEGGDAGRCAVWTDERTMYYQNALHRVRFFGDISVKFFKYTFELYKANGIISQHCKGETIKHLVQNELYAIPFPLPPLAEQKRIVEKIEELLPLIDRYEQAWTKLEDFNKRFPSDLQKSILQMAIQGKLVEQRPEEGTGEDLYKEIQAEKAKLIKEGKIKKEKEFLPISDEEKPFDIPENWTWVRFGNLGSYRKGPFGSALTKNIFVSKGSNTVKVYEQKNAIQKDASLGEYYITREYFESKMAAFEVYPGDIIVSCAGTIGETYVLPDKIEQGIINQALMRMQIFKPIYIPYFLTFFDVVLKQNARSGSKGSAIKNIPPFEILKNYLVPLPPLGEQKRIVERLETLLAICNKLK